MSLSAQRRDRYGYCMPAASCQTKAGPIFEEPKLSIECLEALILLRDHVKDFLQTRRDDLKHISIFLSKDAAIADLLEGCLRELGLPQKVWSLDGLATLDDACLEKKVTEIFGRVDRSNSYNTFLKYVKQLRWSGEGELPLSPASFRRQEGLLPRKEEPESQQVLPKGMGMLLQYKSPQMQGLQSKLTLKMQQLHDLAEHHFLSSNITTSLVLSNQGKNFAEDIGVGWTCVWLVCSKTKSLLEKLKSTTTAQSWGELLDKQLDDSMMKLRCLMPWKCLPSLSSLTKWHAGFEATAPRPPIWIDLLGELDYNVDPHKALEEVRSLDAGIWKLMRDANQRFGSTMAIGLVNSLVLNYRAAVKVRCARTTPALLIQFMIAPRAERLGEFADLVGILFHDDRAGTVTDKGRVPLKVKHVMGLAQDWC